MYIDLSQWDPANIYHLMTQTVVPRPIAWVLTESQEDNFNLAPFSYFTPVSSNPPLLMISIGKKPNGDIKDTAVNVKKTRKLVIHIANGSLAKSVTRTAATLEHGESEVTANDIELEEFEGFSLPRVSNCPVAFGCSLYEIQEIGATPQTLLIAKVEKVYLASYIAEQHGEGLKVDARKLNPLSRLGGGEYATLDKVFSFQRPK
ncbi:MULTISPECIES: flavin reductase family protein [Vibrio]|uniref:Flavin reductase family protein n=1 Tax=Vibrio ostreae TaxID=2841925 RepID=A0A975UD60_9VIBR|nr:MULTISPECIES: flavin reductase family protein [Vibrio]QXO18906.1 flavin reductase family protein [Vibrio ostreae]WGY46762.1 flavin reductase family protein [Vibrio sp. ABG19]